MSRNSSFRFKGSETDIKALGRELNVQAVLTGRIATVGDILSISAELVSTNDNSVIWGEQFARKMSDVEKLQTDIAQSIAQKLRIKLSGPAERRIDDPEAYRLYLLGRYNVNRLSDDGFRKGVEYFRQSMKKTRVTRLPIRDWRSLTTG